MLLPISLCPEPESVHFGAVRTEGRIAIGCPVQIHINQLLEIRAHNLEEYQ